MIFYGILDVLAKPVFCFIHLWQLSRLDLTALQLQSGKFSSAAVGVAAYDREKNGHHHHTRSSEAPMTIVDNEPRTTGVAYSPKKGAFGRTGGNKSSRSANAVSTTGTNNLDAPNTRSGANGPRASESTAVGNGHSSSSS